MDNGASQLVISNHDLLESVPIGEAINKDQCYGTSRNTTKAVAGITAGCGLALGGAAVGTAIFPVVGTIIGGVIGGIGGLFSARAATEVIGDATDYDIEEKVCKKCQEKFKVRKYKGDKSSVCQKCA